LKKNHLCGILGTLLLTSICLHTALNPLPFSASGVGVPTKLAVYVGPPQVPADNKVYDSIFVQLQDASGKPARASEDISISLSSSETAVGSVDPTLTIRQGDTYAVAKFYSTYTPGSTTITALASGLTYGQASMTTVGPVPNKLAVYGLPPVLPANNSSYDAVIVQLQDASGVPAKAPIGNVSVSLSSSETSVGTVASTVTILSGSTYTVTVLNTTSTPGSTTITAASSDYTTGQTTITTQNITKSGPPKNLKVYVGPPRVPAEGDIYDSIAIQLQDLQGRIANVGSDLNVTLSSSNTAVGRVYPSVNVTKGNTYVITRFNSTYNSGSTTITALASGYTSGWESMTTVGPIPERLAVYCVPPFLPADGDSYDAVFVQLQALDGRPARDPTGDINVILSSSNTAVGNVSSSMVIPFRKTYSLTRFNTTYTAGSTTITAVTAGYTSGQYAMTTHVIDVFALSVTLTPNPTSVSPGGKSTIRVHVSYGNGIPVPSATITFTSDQGGNFSSTKEEGNGYYNSTFTAPTSALTQPIITISATASKSGYTSGQGETQVTVGPFDRGNIHLYIKDASNNTISEASVNSIAQPTGQSSLSGTTNTEGLVTFENVLAGNYTLEIIKTGYNAKIKHITVTAAQTTTDTFYLDASASAPAILPLILIAIVAGGIIVTVLIAWWISTKKKRPRLPELVQSSTLKPPATSTSK